MSILHTSATPAQPQTPKPVWRYIEGAYHAFATVAEADRAARRERDAIARSAAFAERREVCDAEWRMQREL